MGAIELSSDPPFAHIGLLPVKNASLLLLAQFCPAGHRRLVITIANRAVNERTNPTELSTIFIAIGGAEYSRNDSRTAVDA